MAFPNKMIRVQATPNRSERVEILVPFGAASDWVGDDDDFTRTLFFFMSEKQQAPVYLQIWDPDCGDKKEWASRDLPITAQKRSRSLNFRFISSKLEPTNLVLFVTDQFDRVLTFFTIHLGGPPRYQYDIKTKIHR